MRIPRRFLTLSASLALVLILPILGACASEEGADRPDQDARDRPTSSLFGGSESAPDATRDDPLGVGGDQAIEIPKDSSASSALLPSREGQPCPQCQLDPDAVLPPSGTSPETDKEALIALFEATGGETWDTSSTWVGLSPIGEWRGVGVGSDGRVTSLELYGISGDLPPELGNLTALRELSITDSEIAGEIPPELGNLSSLETLNLGGNQLCGELPPGLDDLTHLRSLDLGHNRLTGRLPDTLARLAKLETLNLADNQLTGEVPSWLAGLMEMTALDLSNNQLDGELPPELDQLALGLQRLNLNGNQLSGCQSDFLRDEAPDSIDSLPVCSPESHAGDTEALIALHQAWGKPNLPNWLSREPISEWQGVSVGIDGRVAALSLSGLTGELPPELGNLTSLRTVRISTSETGGLTCSPDVEWQQGTILAGVCKLETIVFASVSAGDKHTCGVRTNGAVTCWGLNSKGQAAPAEGRFALVSVGSHHTYGVRADGPVACWGEDLTDRTTPPEGEFTSVSAHYHQTCGVRTNGTVACWGVADSQSTPPEGEFTSVSTGGFHTCGVRTNGTVACWGVADSQSTPPEGGSPPSAQEITTPAG